MTVCGRNAVALPRQPLRRVFPGLIASFALSGVLLGLAGSACAQGAPTSLLPSAPPANQPAPPAETRAEPGPRGGGFQVQELQAVSGESFGVLDGDAGLGIDLWRGTRRTQLIELLSIMPGATRSHAMNALARRALLTTATVPPRDAGSAGGPSLLSLRANRLAALGDYEAMARLIAASPGRVDDEALLRQSIEVALMTGDNASACKQTRELVERFTDVFWQKARIFCHAVVGEQSQANLGAALLREQNPKGEATFDTLLRAMQGDKQVKLAKLPQPTALDMAMLNAAKLPIPEDALDTRDPAMLAAIARNAATPIEARLTAGERAEALGTLSTADLAQIYSAVKFTPQQTSHALSESDVLGGARGRALLYVAQRNQSNAAARAELLQRAFVSARAAGLYSSALRLYADSLKAIAATDDLSWFAAEAARALFASNQPLEARMWLSAGRGFTPSSANVMTADVATLPYELMSSPKPMAWDTGRWQRWKGAQGDDAPLKATILLTLLEGLDRAAPDEAWDGLARVQIDPAANLPPPAVLRRLEVAAATERRGAAVLAGLATLGPEGPAGCHPIVLGMAIAGLRYIGLEAEARALAIDAAIGQGL